MNKNIIELGLLVCAGALLTLNGCSNPKKSLGLTRTAPDEFTVVSQSPLTVPPEFTLTPPAQAGVKVRDTESMEKAKASLFSTEAEDSFAHNGAKATDDNTDDIDDEGANALLAKADALNPNPDIRKTITEEGSLLVEEDKDFTDKLIFWDREETDPTATVVDAAKEKQRIQENQALGKPVNEGETPVIVRKKKALLEFN